MSLINGDRKSEAFLGLYVRGPCYSPIFVCTQAPSLNITAAHRRRMQPTATCGGVLPHGGAPWARALWEAYMKATRLIVVLLGVIPLSGCPHDVELTLHNADSQALAPSITTKKSNGLNDRTISLGSVQPDASITQKFKVDDDGSFAVAAAIPSSATVFDEPSHTVTSSDPKPLTVNVQMKVSLGRRWDPSSVQAQLSNLFSQLGPDIGFKPVPVDLALDTYFGGLYVFGPEAEGFPVKFQLNAGSFSPKVQHLTYPSTSSQSSADMSRDLEAKISGSAPVFGKISTYTGTSDVYKFNFDMHGFGMVPKVEPDGWSYATALNGLSQQNRDSLCAALAGNSNSRLLYVNTMYVIQAATFDYQDAQKLSAGVTADAGSIVTASGAYTYSNSRRDNQSYQTSVINLAGVTWKPGELSICPGAHPSALARLEPSGHLMLTSKMPLVEELEKKDVKPK